MAEFQVTGDVEPLRAIREPRAVWPGSDVPVRLRVFYETVPETAPEANYLSRSQLTSISYRVYRRTSEAIDEPVAEYTDVDVTLATAVLDDNLLPVAWGKDGQGYNVRFVVPGAAFSGNVLHTIAVKVISGGITRWCPIYVDVQGPRGATTPGGGGAIAVVQSELMFSQTATSEVHAEGAKTNLVSSGIGVNLIPANSVAAGDEFLLRASGSWGSKDTAPGSASLEVAIGAEAIVILGAIFLTAAQPSTRRWRLEARLIYRTIGPAATAILESELVMDGAGIYCAATPAEVTLPTTAGKVPSISIDFSIADAANVWRMDTYTLQKAGGVAA